ncbi:hypothetical protein GCM10010431_81750 [Streptomyces kunmingensis]
MTVGFPVTLSVTELEPFTRLSWETTVDGDATGSSAYHGWVISATDKWRSLRPDRCSLDAPPADEAALPRGVGKGELRLGRGRPHSGGA